MKVGDRVKTNEKCDFKDKVGTVVEVLKDGTCLIVKLDCGITLATMFYAVNPI